MDEAAGSGPQSMDVCAQDIWLDKAEVCLSMGLCQPARQLLAETHRVAVVSRAEEDQNFQKKLNFSVNFLLPYDCS